MRVSASLRCEIDEPLVSDDGGDCEGRELKLKQSGNFNRFVPRLIGSQSSISDTGFTKDRLVRTYQDIYRQLAVPYPLLVNY